MSVGSIILEQLGGRRFAVMTGAKNFTSFDRGLMFSLPSNFATSGINKVRITLTAMDDYNLEFLKIRGASVKPIAYHEGIYADTLQSTFTQSTGLDTRL